jgi:N-acetyl sugar amidotransferase
MKTTIEFLSTRPNLGYRQCERCVLDTFVSDIIFDPEGICHYCRNYDCVAGQFILIDERLKKEKLDQIISDIKAFGKGKPYDSIVGLSGGADSSYLVYLAHQFGLRPLIVHFDNGWNSEVSVRNVKNIVTKLGLDLYTYVINWEEFKDLQKSYLKASVIDIEVPTDQLIMGSLYRIALKKGIKYILDGCNVVTEQVMPKNWNYSAKLDPVNLKNIHRKFGTVKLRNFPEMGFFRRNFYQRVLGIKSVSLLDHVFYIKKDAKDILTKELDWQDYGGKHYESVFTRFYQGYILPRKFGIDKRKAHLSNLICSGQITKAEALRELERAPYPDDQQLQDREYVIKKLGFSESEFDQIMNLPVRSHDEFGSEIENLKYLRFFVRKVLKIKRRVH